MVTTGQILLRLWLLVDNHLLKVIKDTTEFIESSILEPIHLDDISQNANISKFHLLRIWKGATNTGIMEYVRRRRIALSLGDLLKSHTTIDFISSKYSFGCERTYARVFKDEFGITPARWRRNPSPLNILDRFNADFMSCAGDGLVFYKSVSVLPLFSIAGLEYEVNIQDNRQNQTANRLGVDFFHNHRKRIDNPVHRDVYFGLTTASRPPGGYTLYQPSIQVNEYSIIPSDMKVKTIKPHKFGVFTYMGPHAPEEITAKRLTQIWHHVYDVWMPTIQFSLKDNFGFEYINYAKCNKQYCECDLYYPISLL